MYNIKPQPCNLDAAYPRLRALRLIRLGLPKNNVDVSTVCKLTPSMSVLFGHVSNALTNGKWLCYDRNGHGG